MNKIINQWKNEQEDTSSDDENISSQEKLKKREKKRLQKIEETKNDFRVDRERIKAAHGFEENNERLAFDPDQDGFNFGYEMALTFKVRINMFRLIRKEILSNHLKFWDDQVDDLALKFNKEEFKR